MNNRSFRLRVFSRHGSHDALRNVGLRFPVLAAIRLGSLTKGTLSYKVEINKPGAIKNSANKLLMKQCFVKAGVKTADYYTYIVKAGQAGHYFNCHYFKNKEINGEDNLTGLTDLPFPIVAKSHFGSRGMGNYLLKNKATLEQWMRGKDMSRYLFEKFYSYQREYRLHVTEEGCFYACRKMVKSDCPKDKVWSRHDSNCIWAVENNPNFDMPSNWKDIEADCVKALKAVGLDVCSFDVKVQTSKDKNGKIRENPDYILIECNSGSSFGVVTLEKYVTQIPKIIDFKIKGSI